MLNLYPNPNTGSFNIKGKILDKTDDEMHLTILNSLGQLVYEETVTTQQKDWSHEIDLGDKATGS